MRAAKVQASLCTRAVSPEPSLLAHTSSESRETFRQKARSLAPLNGWACTVKICHDGMLEDKNSLDGAHIYVGFEHEHYNDSLHNSSLHCLTMEKIYTVKSPDLAHLAFYDQLTLYFIKSVIILSTRNMSLFTKEKLM